MKRLFRARKDQAPFIVTGRIYILEDVSPTMAKLWDYRTRASMTLERTKLRDTSLFEELSADEIEALR